MIKRILYLHLIYKAVSQIKEKFKIDILITIYPMGCKIGNTVDKNDISLLAS